MSVTLHHAWPEVCVIIPAHSLNTITSPSFKAHAPAAGAVVMMLKPRVCTQARWWNLLKHPFTTTFKFPPNSLILSSLAGRSSATLSPAQTIKAIHSLPIKLIKKIAELRFEKSSTAEDEVESQSLLGLTSSTRSLPLVPPEVTSFVSDERIASVTVDPNNPSVIWEQREKDLRAERDRAVLTSPGFSFSAAGLVFPYHLGVSECLAQKGYMTDTTPLAGSSAGAIVCAVLAAGASMQDALMATKELAQDCRENGTAFRLGAVLRAVLERFLPNDIHIKASGRMRVAVTQVFQSPRALLIDQFDSKADLINALITSSFIPGYLAPRPATLFRNRVCVDGGITQFMPPTVAPLTVRVCAFSMMQLGYKGFGISPDCSPEGRATTRQLLSWALEPAEDAILDHLFWLGHKDAQIWTASHPLNELRRQSQQSDTLSSSTVQRHPQSQYF